jgi:hypothetical protein
MKKRAALEWDRHFTGRLRFPQSQAYICAGCTRKMQSRSDRRRAMAVTAQKSAMIATPCGSIRPKPPLALPGGMT